MIGMRPEEETLYYPVTRSPRSTSVRDLETYDRMRHENWPGDYKPWRLPWLVDSEAG